MIQNRKLANSINLVFGIFFGTLIFRLALGPAYNYPALYTHLVWVILYPVSLLRAFSNIYIYILFYTLFWLYVLTVRIVILEAPFGKTLLKTLIWMPLVALPFVPFGIEYFSLARYITTIGSYILRLLPFIGLLVLLFLANRLYFDQDYLFTGVWTLVNFLLVIIVITLSDLLPLIKSQFFFHALGYRFSLANNFISGTPILAFCAVIILSIFYISIFERQFLRLPFKKTTLVSIITPIGLLVALSFLLMIMRDDFRRYRYFDYQEGIATVYFAKYDDRQTISFDDAQFSISSGRYSVFYPFGKFSIQDTLHRHTEDILRMKIIEGLDYYRLERIMKILAHGPRDEDIYRKLHQVMERGHYLLPAGFKFWMRYVERRYEVPANDIVVSGCIMLNGRPLQNTEFFVNKVSFDNRRVVEPIWQGITDKSGQFQFGCYRDAEVDDAYFGVIFLVSNKLIGKSVDYLKVVHPIPVFSEPSVYVLDTFRIETEPVREQGFLKHVSVTTVPAADSFTILLPRLDRGASLRLTGSVRVSGMVDDIVVDHQPSLDDTLLLEGIIDRVRGSRFNLTDSIGTFEIQMN
jgi:hypothetical protein